MTQRTLRTFWTEDRAAISPLYAVGILALVAVSGVGFDYGRLMALDSELQNAADRAALAAATQLDGNADAMIRAQDAATNTFATAASAYVNETRFANDKRITGSTNSRPITSLTFVFYDGYQDDAVGDVVPINDTDGADAQVVEVTVNSRQVFYALTPVVGAFSSGNVIGKALAGLESGTCEVAPMFFCLPHDADGNNILDFPRASDTGRELRLHLRNNASETFTPGNFGFLDVPYGTGPDKNRELGLNESLAGCFESSPDQETETGSRTPMGNSLNSRLDVFISPIQPNHCDASGNYCPSENAKKDWVNEQTANKNAAATCSPSPSNKWFRYSDVSGLTVPNPGYPDDASFTGIVGNGSWGPTTWMSTQNSLYGTSYTVANIPDADGNGSISRYEAFMWERDTATDLIEPVVVAEGVEGSAGGTKRKIYCAYPNPVEADPFPATSDQKDRRVITVGAVACEDGYPNGSKPVRILRWVDLFVVRPVNGSSETEFFTEIIGPARKANGDSGFQYFGRKKPVLIR
jgi:Flp pilus assembly protein TadG